MAPASAKAASYAQFANPETFDGYVRLRAVSVPTTAITAQYYIVQGGGQTDSGSGTVVEGYTKAQVDNKIATAIKLAKEEQKLLDHPVGSVYQSIEPTSPAELFGGEWQSIGSGRVLMGANDSHAAGTTAEAGLPNLVGTFQGRPHTSGSTAGGALVRSDGKLFTITKLGGSANDNGVAESSTLSKDDLATFDASKYNSIYGNSTTVQPPAYYVYM